MHAQVRFCLKFWNKDKEMPSREEMLEDAEIQMQKQWDKDKSLRKAHLLGVDQVGLHNINQNISIYLFYF